MTTKRDKKDEPEKAKRPKLKKEKLKDLDPPEGNADEVRAGAGIGGPRPPCNFGS